MPTYATYRVEHQDPPGGDEAEQGSDVALTVDCRQVDWENYEGDAWDGFSVAYADGFNEGCERLFALSPDGSLYAEDYEYTTVDCTNLEPDVSDEADLPVDVPDFPDSTGTELGVAAGCRAVFDARSPILSHV